MKIKKFIMFLGPVRSGHSFFSKLLSIHPKVAISIEQQPIKKVIDFGYKKQKLFNSIVRNCSSRENMRVGGYDYYICDSQLQNENVEIIGDSIAGFKQDRVLSKLDEFSNIIEIPIKWFIVHRNPFDIITSFHKMNKKGIRENINNYTKIIKRTQKRKDNKNVKDNFFTFYLEMFVKEPELQIQTICKFLGIKPTDELLYFCKSKTELHKMFDRNLWNKKEIREVNNFIKKIPDLNRYYNDF